MGVRGRVCFSAKMETFETAAGMKAEEAHNGAELMTWVQRPPWMSPRGPRGPRGQSG